MKMGAVIIGTHVGTKYIMALKSTPKVMGAWVLGLGVVGQLKP